MDWLCCTVTKSMKEFGQKTRHEWFEELKSQCTRMRGFTLVSHCQPSILTKTGSYRSVRHPAQLFIFPLPLLNCRNKAEYRSKILIKADICIDFFRYLLINYLHANKAKDNSPKYFMNLILNMRDKTNFRVLY